MASANGAQSQLGYCHPYNSDGTLQRWLFIQAVDSNGNAITENGGNKVYYLYNLAAQRCLGVTATRVGELLSRPVDQDRLGGLRLGVLAGPFDGLSVDERRASADQGDEVGCVHGAPAVLC